MSTSRRSPPPVDVREAERVLRIVQPAPGPEERVELRLIPVAQDRPPRRGFYRTVAELVEGAVQSWTSYHGYVGVVLRHGHDGTAAGTSRAGCCWADIDGKLFVGADDPKQAARSGLERFPLRPSVLVDSGNGYHAYWVLDEPLDLRAPGARQRLETVNRGLARAVCGPNRRPDPTHDVARVLRLPGSWNRKYRPPRPVRVVWCSPDRRYPLALLEGLLAERFAWALATRQTHPPSISGMGTSSPLPFRPPARSVADLRTRAETGPIRRRTLGLLDLPGAQGYRSPSEADAAVVAGLLRAGLAVDEVLAVVTSSARGRDAVERKGPRYAPRYWTRTVANVAGYAAADRRPP